jgi:hypothetical protein
MGCATAFTEAIAGKPAIGRILRAAESPGSRLIGIMFI